MRILGWCRSAVAGDGRTRLQRQQIEAWAYTPGHTIAGWIIEEGVSRRMPLAARDQIRPWLSVRDGDWDCLVTVEIGRLSDSGHDIAELVKRLRQAGKHLITLDDCVDTTCGRNLAEAILSGGYVDPPE